MKVTSLQLILILTGILTSANCYASDSFLDGSASYVVNPYKHVSMASGHETVTLDADEMKEKVGILSRIPSGIFLRVIRVVEIDLTAALNEAIGKMDDGPHKEAHALY